MAESVIRRSVQSASLCLFHPREASQCNQPYVLICPHQEVTSYHPEKERGTDSSALASSFPLCSLTVPKLLLPHGTNGSEPHSRTQREHAGRYRCQYRVSESAEMSVKSDPVELVLTDLRYPPSRISLHPEQHVGTGTNVTIRCWNKDYGATFFLHKDGSSDPLQRQDSSGGGTATFTLFGVTPADSGTYRCSYHPKNYSFLSSPLGDSMTLEVTPTPARPGAELVSRGNLVVAVVRGCAAVLIFALGVFFVIDAHSLWIRRDESLGGEGI
ncbi:leukocyte immunoglobulin-like receptor subfamily B member 1 isoform X2 [Gallus gallus]|uniref:leukocyte immunoglobulin-like receptor subfamily B member 1 isoform X2 n=1 Tax=Gallus gallus TaxID=9031 RepID=UPI001F00063B|nr:leukocyte immunoglobulin-like receptor subfamily B member 1 isoform X2 [Gallus gallus]